MKIDEPLFFLIKQYSVVAVSCKIIWGVNLIRNANEFPCEVGFYFFIKLFNTAVIFKSAVNVIWSMTQIRPKNLLRFQKKITASDTEHLRSNNTNPQC